MLQWLLSLQVFFQKEYETLQLQAKTWSTEGNDALVRLANKGSMDPKLAGSIDISVAEVVEALDWTAHRTDLDLLPVGVMLGSATQRTTDVDTLYLVADHLSQTTHKSLFAASLRHLFHVTETGEKNVTLPPLFALDELANLAALPDFPNIISTIRSSAQVLTGVQELSQMSARWGQDSAVTIVGNHLTKVVLGGSADAGAMRAWETLATTREHNKKDDDNNIAASDFRTIPDKQAVIIARNADPFDVRLADPQQWLQPNTKTATTQTANPDDLPPEPIAENNSDNPPPNLDPSHQPKPTLSILTPNPEANDTIQINGEGLQHIQTLLNNPPTTNQPGNVNTQHTSKVPTTTT